MYKNDNTRHHKLLIETSVLIPLVRNNTRKKYFDSAILIRYSYIPN